MALAYVCHSSVTGDEFTEDGMTDSQRVKDSFSGGSNMIWEPIYVNFMGDPLVINGVLGGDIRGHISNGCVSTTDMTA